MIVSEETVQSRAIDEDQPAAGHVYLYKCATCGQAFGEIVSLHGHSCAGSASKRADARGENAAAAVEDAKFGFACETCGKCFGTKAHWAQHQRTHDVKVHKCAVCGVVFDVRSHLLAHAHSHTDLPQRRHRCDTCGRAFYELRNLAKHMQVHTEARPHKCTLCRKTFLKKAHLVRHTNNHLRSLPNTCPTCGKVFSSEYYLTKHQVETRMCMSPDMFAICDGHSLVEVVSVVARKAARGEQSYECSSLGVLRIRDDESVAAAATTNGRKEWRDGDASQSAVGKSDEDAEREDSVSDDGSGAADEKTDVAETVERIKQEITTDDIDERKMCEKSADAKSVARDVVDAAALQDRAHACSECGKAFSQLSRLTAHMQVHNCVKPFRCATCDKTYASKYSLRMHAFSHAGVRPHTCDTCGKSFAGIGNLNKHKRRQTCGVRRSSPQPADAPATDATDVACEEKHGGDGEDEDSDSAFPRQCSHGDRRQFVCDTCGLAFLRPRQLMLHKRRHNGEGPVVCQTCGKSFSTKYALRSHEYMHMSSRPYMCEMCGNQFSYMSNLNKHQRNMICFLSDAKEEPGGSSASLEHEAASVDGADSRPHKCTMCTKTFRTKDYLALHQRVHTNERPYLCRICGMAFRQSNHLVSHIRIHTGEKPHQCATCGKAFAKKVNLDDHEHTHQPGRPFVCDACGQSFRGRSSLNKHRRESPACLAAMSAQA